MGSQTQTAAKQPPKSRQSHKLPSAIGEGWKRLSSLEVGKPSELVCTLHCYEYLYPELLPGFLNRI